MNMTASLVLLLAVLALFPSTAPGASGAVEARAGSLARHLQPLLSEHIIAGAIVLVADKKRILEVDTIGYADLEAHVPMAADGLCWMASMTKSMTATAVMMLVDEGRVSVDAPVARYLPAFANLTVAGEGHAPRAARTPLLVRHLLTHTSGLASTPRPPDESLRENTEILARLPLEFEPGTNYQYSNTGINTLGRIIEVVSGKSYAGFMEERLFTPLRMTDTTFWPSQEQAARLVKTYRRNAARTGMEGLALNQAVIANSGSAGPPEAILAQLPNMARAYRHRFAGPAAGVFSTAADVARFCQMLLNGGEFEGRRYVSAAAVRQMRTLQTGHLPVNPRGGFGSQGYGFGWTVYRSDGEPGGSGFGHQGARKTMMWVDPDRELVLVLLVQCGQIGAVDQRRLYSAFIGPALEKYARH